MKRILYITLCLMFLAGIYSYADGYNSIWRQINGIVPSQGQQVLHPVHFIAYTSDTSFLRQQLSALSDKPEQGGIVSLPMPDGSFLDFKVWRTHIMAPSLEARYSNIVTCTAYAVSDPRITAKLDYTVKGFHAMIYNGNNTALIDPYSTTNDGCYICYYRRDYSRPIGQLMKCETTGSLPDIEHTNALYPLERTINGSVLRLYRLALACTAEYAAAVDGTSPTKSGTLSAMVTTLNRVNGIYERELAITLQLVSQEDTLIFLDAGTEPYYNNNGVAMLSQNQVTIDNLIGTANYDIGHVLSTGGGGIAAIGCVCNMSKKAQGVSGEASPEGDAFDVDYVCHEMGHQFGASHTFNDNTQGACSGNAEPTQAYEPGGGSTIMCYAGICTPDDIQAHGDDYFHNSSLQVISNYITSASVATCPLTVPSSNKSAAMPSFSAAYSIPYLTPFELTAPALTDSVSDTLNSYCWEEWDLGGFGETFAETHKYGPIFRSFTPDTSRTRVFPALAKLVNNITDYPGEKLPDSARTLTFKLTIRDIYNGLGCFNIPNDSIILNVVNTGAPFAVTQPSATGITWVSRTKQVVKWNVSNTNASPVNCAAVDIYLSIDGGYTYPFLLASGVPNDGIDTVTVPMTRTDQARIKVKGSGNVFFNISTQDFSILWPTAINDPQWAAMLMVYPVPASGIVHIRNTAGNTLNVLLNNSLGQTYWKGNMQRQLDVPVEQWPAGVYYVQFTDASGQRIVKQVVVQ